MARTIIFSLLLAVPLFAQRITPEAALSGDVSVAGARSLPAAVWTGTSFAIFWSDSAGLFGGTVGLNGRLLESPTRIAEANEIVGGVALNGQELLLLTTSWPDPKIVARRLTLQFAPIGGAAVLADGLTPGVVWNGSEFFAHWIEFEGFNYSIIVAKIRDGEVTARRVVNTTPAPRPDTVSLAATPIDLLLVWEELFGCGTTPSSDPCVSSSRLRATRLDRNLDLLDPTTIALAETGYLPSAVSNGQEYLVAWTDLDALNAQRVHPSGALLGNRVTVDPLHLGTNVGASAAWDGRRYFAVTQDNTRTTAGIFGTALDASGAIAGAPVIPIHIQENYYEGPVTFAGPPSYFLVAYRRYDERRQFRTFIRVVNFPEPSRRRSAAH